MAPGGPPGGHRWNFTFRVDRVARGGAAVGGGSGSTDCRRGASNSQPGCAPILAPSSCMYSVILKEIHDDDDDRSIPTFNTKYRAYLLMLHSFHVLLSARLGASSHDASYMAQIDKQKVFRKRAHIVDRR